MSKARGKKHSDNTTGRVYVRETKTTCECTGGETPGLTVTVHGHMTVQQYGLCLREHRVLGTSLKSSAHKASFITELRQPHQATERIMSVKTTLWRSHEAAPFRSANVNSALDSTFQCARLKLAVERFWEDLSKLNILSDKDWSDSWSYAAFHFPWILESQWWEWLPIDSFALQDCSSTIVPFTAGPELQVKKWEATSLLVWSPNFTHALLSEQESKKGTDRSGGKAGNRAGLMRWMQGRCAGKCVELEAGWRGEQEHKKQRKRTFKPY